MSNININLLKIVMTSFTLKSALILSDSMKKSALVKLLLP